MGCNRNTYDSTAVDLVFLFRYASAPANRARIATLEFNRSTRMPVIKTGSYIQSGGRNVVTGPPELCQAAVYSKLGQKLSFSFVRNYRNNHLCVAATAQNINTKMIGTMIGGTSHAVIRSLIAIAGSSS